MSDVKDFGTGQALMTLPGKKVSKVFIRECNVRDEEFGYDDDFALAQSIVESGKVTNPVQVGVVGITRKEFKKLTLDQQLKIMKGEQGHRRAYEIECFALGRYAQKFPGAVVDTDVPTLVNFRDSLEDVIKARQDHSSHKGLNEYELGRCYKELKESIEGLSDKEITWRLRHLFGANAAESKRTELKANVRKAMENPLLTTDEERHNAEKQEVFDYWKGKRQELQRIHCPDSGTDWLRQNKHNETYGKPYVYLTKKQLVDAHSKPEEELEIFIEQVKAKKGEVVKKSTMLTRKQIEEKRKIFAACEWLDIMFGVVLGDPVSVKKWKGMYKTLQKASICSMIESDVFEAYLDDRVDVITKSQEMTEA